MSFFTADKLRFLLLFWLIAMTAGLVHMLAAWWMLRRARLSVQEFRIFYGKQISYFVAFDTVISIGCIPYGAYLRWDPDEYASAPLAVRIGLPFAGIAAVAVGAAVLLGIPHVVQSISSGFSQIISGALSPTTSGRDLIARLFGMQSLPIFVGIVWAKYVAFHLLPVPLLPGGQWVITILDPKNAPPLGNSTQSLLSSGFSRRPCFVGSSDVALSRSVGQLIFSRRCEE